MEQHTTTSIAWQRVEPWLKTAGSLALWIGIFVGIHWIVSPTDAEQAAARESQHRYEQEQFEEIKRAHTAKCSSYPSSDCEALTDFDDQSAPCFVGQVKANRRSGVYHTPQSPWYGRTHADVLCFKTPSLASQAGFRPARGTGD